MTSETITIDRATLYEEVWAEPVQTVASRYGVSSFILTKWCRKLGIPLPQSGHWSKLHHGKSVRRVPLPEAGSRSLPTIQHRRRDPAVEVVCAKIQKTVEGVDAKVSAESEAIKDEPLHPLVISTKKRLSKRGEWDKRNAVRSASNEVLDISVSLTALSRAAAIASAILRAFESTGVTVRVDDENAKTVLDFKGTELVFQLIEQMRITKHQPTRAEKSALERYWSAPFQGASAGVRPDVPEFDYYPTGKLSITVGRYPSRTWNDTDKTQLETRLATIIREAWVLADDVRARLEERARNEAIRAAKWARYEFLRDEREAERQKLRQSELDAKRWARAGRLRAFIAAVEQAGCPDADRNRTADWIKWARLKADCIDPLVPVCDSILDAPKLKAPSLW